MATYSQLLNTTSGKFDELYVRVPPSNDYVDVATIAVDVSTLQSEITTNSDELTDQQVTIDALIDKDNTLQDLIDTKQDILTAQWPIRINGNVISFGFWADLQAQLASHEASIAARQLLLDQLVTLLPPVPPAADYVLLNGISSHISFPSGFSDVLDWTKSWSLGVDFYTLPDAAGDNIKASLFSSGGSHLTLHRSGAPAGNGVNWGSDNTCCNNLYNVAAARMPTPGTVPCQTPGFSTPSTTPHRSFSTSLGTRGAGGIAGPTSACQPPSLGCRWWAPGSPSARASRAQAAPTSARCDGWAEWGTWWCPSMPGRTPW